MIIRKTKTKGIRLYFDDGILVTETKFESFIEAYNWFYKLNPDYLEEEAVIEEEG